MTGYTPPPPGDTTKQLPDHILNQIRRYLPPYVSTACITARAIAEATMDLAARGEHTHLNEWTRWRERMHTECRLNMKFSGQSCLCHCHEKQWQEQARADMERIAASGEMPGDWEGEQ